jgi:MFS family permease
LGPGDTSDIRGILGSYESLISLYIPTSFTQDNQLTHDIFVFAASNMALLEGRFLLAAVTALTCLGFLLIGYDNGLMGGLVNSDAFDATFDHPSNTITGLIVAIYEVGCFLGSVATAIFGEQIGRRKSIGTGTVIMILGALLQATSYSRSQLVVARVVSGVGMGFINSTVPVFQSEFSPKATRGVCRFPYSPRSSCCAPLICIM